MRPAFEAPAPRLFKASASGNDFLVADARALPGWDPGAEATRALCRREEGAGADGLIVLGPSRRADAAFFLRNCDGSEAAFSGNGARCAALLLHELGVRREDGRVDLELAARTCSARVLAPGGDGAAAAVEVSIGAPAEVLLDRELPGGLRGDSAVVGVPYVAVRVADAAALQALDLAIAAPPLRRWDALPAGANVAFFAEESPGGPVALRTWERGVEGETASSGTGCAMVALSIALREPPRGDAARRVELRPLSGARLAVTVSRDAQGVSDLLLEGEARLVAEILPLAGALLPGP